jgi:hypothetical protein
MLSVCLWVTPFQLVRQLTNFLEILYACYVTEEHAKASLLLLTSILQDKEKWSASDSLRTLYPGGEDLGYGS